MVTRRRLGMIGTCLAALVLSLPASAPAEPPAKKEAAPAPADQFAEYESNGYPVLISKQFIKEKPKEAQQALLALAARVGAALDKIPSDRLGKIRSLKFWVEWDVVWKAKTLDGTIVSPAFYVPTTPPTGTDVAWADRRGGIVVPASVFLVEPSAAWVSNANSHWLLHEIAHAYHDQVLGFDNVKVQSAFKVAVDRKLYDDVYMLYPLDIGRFDSRKVKAYARTNEKEYFAELSVAFLAHNTTYPYTRRDLRDHDALGYQLMLDAWKR